MASAEDKPRYDDTLQRIEALLKAYPAANTTAMQVMLLQADYSRAESLTASWITDSQQEESRQEAEKILRSQAGREERLALADDVLDNSGDIGRLHRQVEELHHHYLELSGYY